MPGAALRPQIRVPTLLLDIQVEGLPYDALKTDNVEAGWLATVHLMALAHRRIGMVAGIPGLATSGDRFAGYVAAHAEAGLPCDPALVLPGQFDRAVSHDAAVRLLSLPKPPTAIVTVSNMATMGLLFALRERALKAPRDLSFVGIDDLDFAAILEPRPILVVTPILDMARRSIEVLIAQIENGAPPSGTREVWHPRGPAPAAGGAGIHRRARRPRVKQRRLRQVFGEEDWGFHTPKPPWEYLWLL